MLQTVVPCINFSKAAAVEPKWTLFETPNLVFRILELWRKNADGSALDVTENIPVEHPSNRKFSTDNVALISSILNNGLDDRSLEHEMARVSVLDLRNKFAGGISFLAFSAEPRRELRQSFVTAPAGPISVVSQPHAKEKPGLIVPIISLMSTTCKSTELFSGLVMAISTLEMDRRQSMPLQRGLSWLAIFKI